MLKLTISNLVSDLLRNICSLIYTFLNSFCSVIHSCRTICSGICFLQSPGLLLSLSRVPLDSGCLNLVNLYCALCTYTDS